MAEKKIKRKVVWETSGVSEIIGTILMLSITVVLFSSIITFVGSMPAPRQTFIVDLKCSVEPINQAEWDLGDVGSGMNFRILHQGGQVMSQLWTQIYITVDNTTLVKKVSDGINDINMDGKWSVGEYWNITIEHDFVTLPMTVNSVFSITIVDQERNTLIWQETLGEKPNVYAPIIKRAWIDSDTATPAVNDPGPIAFGKEFKIYAEIVDSEGVDGDSGLNLSALWVNLSSMGLSSYLLQDVVDSDRDFPGDNIYVAVCDGPAKISVGYYFFKFTASDYSNKSAMFVTKFPVGMIVGEKPQIVVRGDNPTTHKYEYITFSNPEPTNGDTIDITATILNIGGKGATVDVSFYKGYNVSSGKFLGTATCLVPEAGQQDAKISWVAEPGGVHTIWVNASVRPDPLNLDFYDPDLSDNTNCTNISVMPKILLVDDDANVNDQNPGDTVSVMRASLEAADFKYDFVQVGAGDGPGYDYGDFPLVNYDVVIWMTGYTTTKTLTTAAGPMTTSRTDDVANLQRFLTNNKTGVVDVIHKNNSGSLWLISEGFWNEAASTASLGAFAADMDSGLRIPILPATPALPTTLYGNLPHPVTDYWGNGSTINTTNRMSGTGLVQTWKYNDNPDCWIALDDGAAVQTNLKAFALSYDSDNKTSDLIKDSRILAQTWDFSRIKDTATQAQYAFKAILWLGNITSKFTQDVAISEQTIVPETVFYKQPVKINFIVRNNGLNTYTSGDNLWYLLRIMDMDGKDMIDPQLVQIDYLGNLSKNTIKLNYTWTPQEIGYHRISIKIDPYNYIEESNELNNEISSYWGTGELNVLYRILVVDDDESQNNGGSLYNETKEVIDALDHLGYDDETYTVNFGKNGPAYTGSGNITALNEYNAVIWVTGDATASLLTTWDITNITSYMELSGGNFWLLGNGMETLDAAFAQNYLKIASVIGNQGMASTLLGREDDDVSHGMEYACDANADADILVPNAGGIGFTYQNNAMTYNNSVRYERTATSTLLQYRSAVTAWNLSSLSENLTKAEFVFMMLRWFDKPEERIEVRMANDDVWISDSHPQLGSGYVIQARVQNAGGTTANVLVRFMDKNTQIGSDSISVSPNSWTTAEIVWVPLFAGNRTIQVQLDPIREIYDDEIFPYNDTGWTNNIATMPIYVYFFWDDMESGTSKWAHSSTITLINGEGPLEYFGNTVTTINIEKDWDYAQSKNITNCTDVGFYHTFDKATWLQEPVGSGTTTTTRIPMDVAVVIDSSGSMSGDDFTNARNAAKDFIALLGPTDRCTLYNFQTTDGDPTYNQARPFAWMVLANRTSFNTTIDDPAFFTNTNTPIWDSIGFSLNYVKTTPRSTGIAGMDYVQVLVALTDGDDYGPDDGGGYEEGSEYYAPGSEVGSTYSTSTWGRAAGLKWGDAAVRYNDVDGTAGHDVYRYNGAYVWRDINTADSGNGEPNNPDAYDATTNVAGQSRTGLINAPAIIYTVGLGVDPHTDTRTEAWAPFTTEYDLWKIANTSGQMGITGEYFYETDSTGLSAIFQNIFESIITQLEGEDQTRSSVPMPGTMSAPPGPMPNAVFTQTRYMRGDSHTINGLPAYQLGTAQSNNRITTTTGNMAGGTGQTVTWGIRVWRRTNAPAENEITSGTMVATVSRNANAAGEQNANWNCPGLTPLATTNAIVVRVYCQVGANAAVQLAEFTTEQLTANQLDATTWTVYYYTTRGTNAGGGGTTRGTFDFGTGTYNSRIMNFQWSTITATTATATGPTGGSTNVASITLTYTYTGTPTSVNLYYTTNGGLNWALAGNDASIADGFPYTLTVSGTYGWIASAVGGTPASTEPSPPADGTAPEATSYPFDNVRPFVSNTVPVNGATGVALAPNVVITFSETMNTATFAYTITPNPLSLVPVWSTVTYSNDRVTISHNAFLVNTRYWVNITAAADPAGNLLNWASPQPPLYSFYFDTITQLSATATGPIGGPTNVAAITITYTWALSPLSVNLYYTTNGGATWSPSLTDATVDGSYGWTCPASGTYGWIAAAAGGEGAPAAGTLPEATSYICDITSPTITVTNPANGATNVAIASTVVVTFSEAMAPASVTYTCVPPVTVWSVVWSAGNTVATYSHTINFNITTLYTFTITAGTDTVGNLLTPDIIIPIIPNPFTFTTVTPTIATVTGPTGISNVAMPTLTYTFSGIPTSVNLYRTTNTGSPFTWTLIGNDATVDGTYTPGAAIPDGTYRWIASAVGGGSLETSPPLNTIPPEAASYFLDTVKPASQCVVAGLYWQNTAATITAIASDPNPPNTNPSGVASVTLYYRYSLNNATNWGLWTSFSSDATSPYSWGFTFPSGNGFYEFYTRARDVATNFEDAPPLADLRHGYITNGGGGGTTPGLSPPDENFNKSAVTKPMDLRNLTSANLEFWHKYNMVPGANGGFLEVGYKETAVGPMKWKYVVPSSAYTGNLRLNITQTERMDSYGTFIQWGWNGISGRGTFTWEKVSLDLLPWVTMPTGGHMNGAYDLYSSVCVKFNYTQYGGGTGYGWYIDDVRVTVTRPNTAPTATSQDVWHRTIAQAHSGNYSWGNVDPVLDPVTGLYLMKPGIDNSLRSSPIDLTNARIANLSAYVKFNFNTASGAPPDGFRVEITTDNGVTWKAVNLGVRSAWNVSGIEADSEDGYPGDGKSYSGITDSVLAGTGTALSDSYWVNIGTLTRVNIDLSSFSGNAIQIRFRVITNSSPAYAHSNNAGPPAFDPGFGGFYIDDVQIEGETILG